MVTQALVARASRYLEDPVLGYVQKAEVVLPMSATAKDVITAFESQGADIVFVVQDLSTRRLAGVISKSDWLGKVFTGDGLQLDRPVEDFVNRKVVVLKTADTLGQAMRAFSGDNPLGRPLKHIPVVDNVWGLVGYLDCEAVVHRVLANR